jgi:antitoxin FitA
MATLNIRNLPKDIHQQLRIRAAKSGRSMEAEARAILTNACSKSSEPVTATSLQAMVDQMYGQKKPRHVVEDLLLERREASKLELLYWMPRQS